jgi:radical SAM protein with 4Fe4S-binding SPASM domain
MCGRDNPNFIKTFLDISILKELEVFLKYAEEVTLFGWGEPTVHPKFSEFLRVLYNYNVRKYFVTNGMLLNKFIDDIFRYKVDIIAVSLDGATPQTNNRIRVRSDFKKIIDNASLIQNKKKYLGVSYPYMNLVFTAMRSNIEELPQMVYLTKELGLEELKVVYLTVFNENLISENLHGEKELVRRYFEKAIEIADNLKIKIKLPHYQGEDEAGELSHKPCYAGWRDLFIGSDGSIRPCQSTSYIINRFDKNADFKEIWNSKEFRDFRSRVNDTDKMPEQCRLCYQSSYANWNKKESFIQINTDFAPEWKKTPNK